MPDLPTALLLHLGHGRPHYDWLLAFDDAGPLVTFRVGQPATDWLDAGRLELTRLADHRRTYLTYQGPVSGDRGMVSRVDEGTHQPQVFAMDHILTTVTWRQVTLWTDLTQVTDDRWSMTIEQR